MVPHEYPPNYDNGYGEYNGDGPPPPRAGPPPDDMEGPPVARSVDHRPPPAPPGHMGGGKPYIIKPRLGALLIIFGVIILFMGIIVTTGANLIDEPEYDDYDYDDLDDYQDDMGDYQDSVRSATYGGRIITWIGVMLVAFTLFAFGIGDERLDWKVKASWVSAGTALLIVSIIMSVFAGL